MRTDILKRPSSVALFTGCAAFAVYRLTLAHGLEFIDSGELSTVACTLGIAHPTGYPLFTLLGSLFARLPVAETGIFRLNLMAALFCAAAAGVLVLVFRRVVHLSDRKGNSAPYATVSACAASLLLAYSSTYWSTALEVEVYPLHLLCVSLTLLAFFRAALPLPGESPPRGGWHLFAYCVGLSFANHMTTVLLAPGLLYLYFSRHGGSRRSWTRLATMSVPFAAGLSIYLYLPVRASAGPVLNWGYAVTPERFLWHVTGKQYQVWMFSSVDAMGRQLSHFAGNFPGEFTWAGLLVACAGLLVLWRRARRLAAGVVILFAACVAYAVNYDIHDIDSYFLLAYIATAMAAAAGCSAAAEFVSSRWPRAGRLVPVLLLCLPLAPLASHFRENDESDDHLVEDYTANMFTSLAPGAVVISYQWDYWVSASYYFQNVDRIRPDVTVIDKELLRRSWYIRELERRRPWLVAASRPEVNAFLAQVDLFEHGLPYDPAQIQARYVGMIESFMRRSIAAHPVYVTGEIEPEFTRGFARIPEGLAFRLAPGEGEIPAPFPALAYRPFPRRGRLEDMVPRMYADAYVSRGEYFFLVLHDRNEALKCLENAVLYDRTSPRIRRLASMTQH